MNGTEEITLCKIKKGQEKIIRDNIEFQSTHKERTSNVITKVNAIEKLIKKLNDVVTTNTNNISLLKKTFWIIIGAVLTGTIMGMIGLLFLLFRKAVIKV